MSAIHNGIVHYKDRNRASLSEKCLPAAYPKMMQTISFVNHDYPAIFGYY